MPLSAFDPGRKALTEEAFHAPTTSRWAGNGAYQIPCDRHAAAVFDRITQLQSVSDDGGKHGLHVLR
jgi:hypothetical protein